MSASSTDGEIRARKLVSALAAWPPNRNLLHHSLYLWQIIPSILGQSSAVPEDPALVFSCLVDSLPSKVRSLLASLDDSSIADQRADIPVNWYGRPYRFFFGNMERPLAFMSKFLDDFVPMDAILLHDLGFCPSTLVTLSLLQQDLLASRINELAADAPRTPSDQFQIPPASFQEDWWNFLQESWVTAVGSLSDPAKEEVNGWVRYQKGRSGAWATMPEDPEAVINLFPLFGDGSVVLVPFPQMWLAHLVHLFTTEASKLQSSPQMDDILARTTKRKTIEYAALLAGRTSDAAVFPDVRLELADECSDGVDALLQVDIDKLVVMKSAVGLHLDGFRDSVNAAVASLRTVCDFMRRAGNSEELSVISNSSGASANLSSGADFTIYPLLVFNQVILDPVLVEPDEPPPDTQGMMLTDLQAISAEIEDALHFTRFLEALCTLQKSDARLIYFDFLDVWAWYRDNGHNFIWSVRNRPAVILVPSHLFSTTETESLSDKASLRRLMIEEGIPERAVAHTVAPDTFRFMDPISLAGVIVKTSALKPAVLSLHVCSRNTHIGDINPNESLAEVILRRYEEVRGLAQTFMELAPADLRNRLIIWLYGEQTLQSSPSLGHLATILDANPAAHVLSTGKLLPKGGVGVAILYRESLLQLMAEDTVEGELLLVKTILESIAFAVQASQETIDSVVPAVSISDRKAISVTDVDTGHAWHEPRKPLARSKATEAHTTVRIAQYLFSEGVQQGSYQGQKARDLINQKVFPFLTDSLDASLQILSQDGVLRWVYHQIENSAAYDQIQRMRMGAAASTLVLEYDLDKVAYDTQRESVQIAGAGGLILERLAHAETTGANQVTRQAGEELLGFAIALSEYTQSSEQDYHNLEEINFEIGDDYAFRLVTAADSAVDLASWQYRHAGDDFRREQPARPSRTKAKDPNERYPDADPDLKDIASEFHSQFGYRLADLIEVMKGLSVFPVETSDDWFPLVRGSEKALLEYLVSVIPGCQEGPARASLQSLYLSRELSEHDWRPWLLRGRSHRFAMRPLFPTADEYVYGPWVVERAAKIWFTYLYEGMLPIPDRDLSDGLRYALQEFRDRKNRQFEDDVATGIDQLQLPRIGPRIQCPEDLWGATGESPIGEIDLIAADTVAKKLFVLEVKDPARTLAIESIAEQINDYYRKEDCFQAKLTKKKDYIQSRLSSVLRDLGVGTPDDWRVGAAFVTRFPVVAAYAKDRKYPFVTLSSLQDLTQDR